MLLHGPCCLCFMQPCSRSLRTQNHSCCRLLLGLLWLLRCCPCGYLLRCLVPRCRAAEPAARCLLPAACCCLLLSEAWRRVRVPAIDILIAGWSCKDLSSLNGSRSCHHLGATGPKKGTSASTLQHLLTILANHNPQHFIFENVTGLLTESTSASGCSSGSSGSSGSKGNRSAAASSNEAKRGQRGSLDDVSQQVFDNVSFLFRAVRALGYDMRMVRICPTWAFCPQQRDRFYFFGSKVCDDSNDGSLSEACVNCFLKVAAVLAQPGAPCYKLDDYLLPESSRSVVEAIRARTDKAQSLGGKLRSKWPKLHEEMCRDSGKETGSNRTAPASILRRQVAQGPAQVMQHVVLQLLGACICVRSGVLACLLKF